MSSNISHFSFIHKISYIYRGGLAGQKIFEAILEFLDTMSFYKLVKTSCIKQMDMLYANLYLQKYTKLRLNIPYNANLILSSSNSVEIYKSIVTIRKILSLSFPKKNALVSIIQRIIETGMVPSLVAKLQEYNPKVQFEAAWALTNIASGTSEQTRVVMEHDAVPIFVRLLLAEDKKLKEQAAWALGNIAGDSPSSRNVVLSENNALENLLTLMQPGTETSTVRNATWTLSNFCRGKPQPPFNAVRNALPTLAGLISKEGPQDEEVLTDACWALSYLSDGPNYKIQAVIESGVCTHLVKLLKHKSFKVQTPALRTVGNIVTGDDLQTQTIINCQALPCLLSLLSSTKKSIRKEACWTISNITAGNNIQIQAVIDAGIVPSLINLLNSAEFDIKKEAAWAISNATSGGTTGQINYLVSQGCVPSLCTLLDEVNDAKIITVALQGLENILHAGENLDLKEIKSKKRLKKLKKQQQEIAVQINQANKFSKRTKRRQKRTVDVKDLQNKLKIVRQAIELNKPENPFVMAIEQANGLDKIDNLQQHEDNNVYERAVTILEKYFGAVDEDDAEVAPEIDNNAVEEVLIGEVALNDDELFNEVVDIMIGNNVAAGVLNVEYPANNLNERPDVVNDIAGVLIDPFLPAAEVEV